MSRAGPVLVGQIKKQNNAYLHSMNMNETHKPKRLSLSTNESWSHYSFAFLPLGMLLFVLATSIFDDDHIPYSLLLFFISIALLTSYFKYRELKLHYSSLERTKEQFISAVKATAATRNWYDVKLKGNKVSAMSYDPWSSRDPQKITIIYSKTAVGFNSRIYGDILSVPDFCWINYRHRKTFFRYLEMSNTVVNIDQIALQEIKAKEEAIENESEWSLKLMLKRIIAYVISAGWWLVAILALNSEEYFLFLLFAFLGSAYILFDIYVIVTKYQRNKSK